MKPLSQFFGECNHFQKPLGNQPVLTAFRGWKHFHESLQDETLVTNLKGIKSLPSCYPEMWRLLWAWLLKLGAISHGFVFMFVG